MQQSLAEFTKEAGSMSGGQQYMQQNTRLVVLTLEVASCLQALLLTCNPPKIPEWPCYLLRDMDLQWASNGLSLELIQATHWAIANLQLHRSSS